MDSALIARLQMCHKLPSIPGIARKVLALRDDKTADYGAVAAVLQQDPAIASKLIRWANSPYYGHHLTFSTVTGAVRLLGIHTSLTVALNFSLIDSLFLADRKGLIYSLFFRRALLSAVYARNIGRYKGRVDDEELFLAALLQDVGMMALDQCYPALYASVVSTSDYHAFAREAEHAGALTNHALVSAWLLAQWDFPEHLVQAVKRSYDTGVAKAFKMGDDFERIVMLSGLFADLFLNDVFVSDYSHLIHTSSELLGLSIIDVHCLIDTAAQDVDDVETLFNIALINNAAQSKALLNTARQAVLNP